MPRLCFVALIAIIIGGASTEARDFRSADVYPTESPTVEAVAQMGKLIELRSQGRHRIKSLGESDRDSENYTIAQVRTGALDMARVSLQAFNTSVPSTALLSAPFLFRSDPQIQRIIDGPIGEEILADLQAQDVIGLCLYDLGARSIYTVEKPVRTAADLKGLRLRAQPGDIAANFFQYFGAMPVAMPFSNVTFALRSKTLDGATGNWLAYVSSMQYEAAPFFSATEHARPPGVVIFSRQVWRTLSEDDRKIIRGAARESVAVARGRLAAYEAEARRNAARDGVQFVDSLDMKSFTDQLPSLLPALYPDRKQQDILKRIQAAANGM